MRSHVVPDRGIGRGSTRMFQEPNTTSDDPSNGKLKIQGFLWILIGAGRPQMSAHAHGPWLVQVDATMGPCPLHILAVAHSPFHHCIRQSLLHQFSRASHLQIRLQRSVNHLGRPHQQFQRSRTMLRSALGSSLTRALSASKEAVCAC